MVILVANQEPTIKCVDSVLVRFGTPKAKIPADLGEQVLETRPLVAFSKEFRQEITRPSPRGPIDQAGGEPVRASRLTPDWDHCGSPLFNQGGWRGDTLNVGKNKFLLLTNMFVLL